MVGCVVLNFNDSKTTIELLNRMKNMKSIDVIVVVDNCSTDDSFSVLKQYTSKKIQVIQSVSIPLSEVHAICYRSPHNPLKKSIFFKS